jgi:NlpC/P60 family putative phage cell wall peptidase
MPLTNEQRDAIVAETKSWAGTPYRGWSCLKGCGVDCGQLLYGIFRATGYIPEITDLPKDYSLQIAQHRASTEYVDLVATYMREIPESEVQPGDVVVFRLGFAYAHAGVVISWPEFIIHAIARHGVTGAHGKNEPIFRHADKLFFTLKEEYTQGFASGGIVENTSPRLVGE